MSTFTELKDKIRASIKLPQVKLPKKSVDSQSQEMNPVEEPAAQAHEKTPLKPFEARTYSAEEIIQRHRTVKENSTKKYHFFRKARQEYWADQLGKIEGEMPRDLRRYWESYSIEEQCEHRIAAKEARGWFAFTCIIISLAFYRMSSFGDFCCTSPSLSCSHPTALCSPLL